MEKLNQGKKDEKGLRVFWARNEEEEKEEEEGEPRSCALHVRLK